MCCDLKIFQDTDTEYLLVYTDKVWSCVAFFILKMRRVKLTDRFEREERTERERGGGRERERERGRALLKHFTIARRTRK